MLRSGKKTSMVKKKYLVIFGNIVISKLAETKTNSNFLIGYLDKVIRLLALVLPK